MNVHVKFNIRGMKGRKAYVIAYFESPKNKGVKDLNGKYCTYNGEVSASNQITPGYENTDYKDWVIFIPNDELHLKQGKNTYYCQVQITTAKGHELLATSEYEEFIGTGAEQQPKKKKKSFLASLGDALTNIGDALVGSVSNSYVQNPQNSSVNNAYQNNNFNAEIKAANMGMGCNEQGQACVHFGYICNYTTINKRIGPLGGSLPWCVFPAHSFVIKMKHRGESVWTWYRLDIQSKEEPNTVNTFYESLGNPNRSINIPASNIAWNLKDGDDIEVWFNNSCIQRYTTPNQCHLLAMKNYQTVQNEIRKANSNSGGFTPSYSGDTDNGSSNYNNGSKCAGCGGTGQCTLCKGRGGWIDKNVGMYTGQHLETWIDCPECNETGQCQVCHGMGVIK